MKSRHSRGPLTIGLLVGMAFGWLTTGPAAIAEAQTAPAFPDHSFGSKPIPGGESEAGLRRAGQAGMPSRHETNPQQTPAVISSSYHRAAVSSVAANQSSVAANPDLRAQGSPLRDGAWISQSLPPTPISGSASPESEPKRTPLSPPSSSSSEVKTQSGSTLQMLLSVGSSLMMVLGLFLGSVWLYRKSMGSSRATGLPKNVVQILGRTPVATRQQLVLLRFGPKLVLVSMVQGETRTISEITDPHEVDRLAGLCEGSQPGSISSSFREILSQGVRS